MAAGDHLQGFVRDSVDSSLSNRRELQKGDSGGANVWASSFLALLPITSADGRNILVTYERCLPIQRCKNRRSSSRRKGKIHVGDFSSRGLCWLIEVYVTVDEEKRYTV